MRTNLAQYRLQQVFLNYPFDDDFEHLGLAMHFAVIASGLIPVCARDLTSPDRPRLEMLVHAIDNCHLSAHDFSRLTGEGELNFARFNMPVEMGMALFHALQTQRNEHRCAFFVQAAHDYRIAASDLAGLDPISYENDEFSLLTSVYEWLRDSVQNPMTTPVASALVRESYRRVRAEMDTIDGSGRNGAPNHNEVQELMYVICSNCGWWDWRENRAGQLEFRQVPLTRRGQSDGAE
ncbi:MAG TPA: hypothetical protein VJU86_23515 [Pyrinomonadaceae bacterium]|nr:hypothetical protein [Pyrinomonadaceae bacterium]